jgi:aryl-alcohol dehydrogenase-like predicted oxidoreductase
VTAPIVGATKLAQLADNLGAASLALSAEQVSALDRASAARPPYPWNLVLGRRRELS